MRPLAIIPARTTSKGIKFKNYRLLDGVAPVVRAAQVAREAGCRVLITADRGAEWLAKEIGPDTADIYHYFAGHGDKTAMIAVIQDALAATEEECLLLVQPTQPLREAKHLRAALDLMLTTPKPDCVVSLVAVPKCYHPSWQIRADERGFRRAMGSGMVFPPRRQLLDQTYIRDGTVYAFWRYTVKTYGSLYGQVGRPLIIPAHETCSLDTPDDWDQAEARLRARREGLVADPPMR